jgi:hypothetical protein
MALLVYSEKCKFCADIITFIKTQPTLLEIVRFHNISTQGVPSKRITRVPTLVTNDGIMKVGSDVKSWLESMVPNDFESWDASGKLCYNLDGTENEGMFDLDKYGSSLQPKMTPELEAKISMKIEDAMHQTRT